METNNKIIEDDIDSSVNESQFFTNVLSELFSYPSLTKSESEIDELLKIACTSGSGNIPLLKYAFDESKFLSVYKNKSIIIYCNDTKNLESCNSTNINWYSKTKQNNDTLVWTETNEPVHELITVEISSKAIKDNNLQSMVGTGFELSYLETVLNDFSLSLNSRLVLTSLDGSFIAASNYKANDESNGIIFLKSLNQSEDEVFKCLTIAINEDKNQFSCNVRSKKYEYYWMKENLENLKFKKLILYSVVCKNDIIGDFDIKIRMKIFQIYIFLGIAFFLGFFISYVLSYLISSHQKRILTHNEKNDLKRKHCKIIGINNAIDHLKKLSSLYSNNKYISKEIDESLQLINNFTMTNIFDNNNLLSIKNLEIRKKLEEMYINKDNIILNRNKLKIIQGSFSIPEDTDMEIDLTHEDERISILTNLINDCSPQSFPQRFLSVGVSSSLLRSQILFICQEFGERCGMFQINEVMSIFCSILDQMSAPTYSFLSDSLDFIKLIYINGMQPDYRDFDLEFAVITVTFCWHLAMNDRLTQQKLDIYHYFIVDSEILSVYLEQVLLNLYELLINSMSKDVSKRWKSFLCIINNIVNTSPINMHKTVIIKFLTLFSINKENFKITDQHMLTLSQLIENVSMISYIFHPLDMRIQMTSQIHSQDDKFIQCITKELAEPSLFALQNVLNSQFYKQIYATLSK